MRQLCRAKQVLSMVASVPVSVCFGALTEKKLLIRNWCNVGRICGNNTNTNNNLSLLELQTRLHITLHQFRISSFFSS